MKSQRPSPTILYVITQGNWGGAQRYVLDLATSLLPKLPVIMAVGEPKGSQELIEKSQAASIPTYQFQHLVRRISPWHDLAAIFELKTAYQTLKPQVVHLNSSKAGIIGSLAALLISAKKRPVLVYTAHGWVFKEPLPWLIKQVYFYLEKWTARIKNTIIVTSPEEALVASHELKIPQNKISYISLGLTAPEFLNPKQARTRILEKNQKINPGTLVSQNAPWYVTIANSYATKGLDVLLQAIKKTEKPGEFFIIGDGPKQQALLNQTKQLQLHTVHFLGPIPNAATLLKAFDGFILPSRKEGVPYVLYEALSAGLPIIATRVGGIPSIAQKYPTITLVNPEHSIELAQALQNFPIKKELAVLPTLSEMSEKTLSVYQKITV